MHLGFAMKASDSNPSGNEVRLVLPLGQPEKCVVCRIAITAGTKGDTCLHCIEWLELTGLAEDFAKRIDAHVRHPHLEWLSDTRVRVLIEDVVPERGRNDFAAPDRRRNFAEYLSSKLAKRGWEGNVEGVFWKPRSSNVPSSKRPKSRRTNRPRQQSQARRSVGTKGPVTGRSPPQPTCLARVR